MEGSASCQNASILSNSQQWITIEPISSRILPSEPSRSGRRQQETRAARFQDKGGGDMAAAADERKACLDVAD
jgi:hypothetical protein